MAQVIHLADFRQTRTERREAVFGRFGRRLGVLGGRFAAGLRALGRVQDVDHLLRLSDADLARRGLTRRRIEAYVFGH